MARYVPRQSDTCGIYVPSAYIQSHALIRRTGMPKYLKKTSLDSHFRCNGLPKEANPEVRGKSKACRTDPPYTLATCGFVGEQRIVVGRSGFYRALPKNGSFSSGSQWR